MELKDFISSTLEQIIQGVKQAQENIGEGKINPPTREPNKQHSLYFSTSSVLTQIDTPVFLLEFDIAVNTESGTTEKAGGGIFVASFGFGAQTGESSINKQQNRIKFVIPYTLP